MSKRRAIPAALCALLVALGLTAGVALGGNPHGTPPGQAKQGSASQNNAVQSSSAPGVKPSNSTSHNTSCTSGGGTGASATCSSSTSSNADASKRYGNGKTAAQIANGRGAPAGTQITGPGNSQPHKVCRNGHWVDVHAVKSYGSSTGCGKTKSSAPAKSSLSSAAASGAVLGATSTVRKPAPKQPALVNVLGATATLRSHARAATLPFTGLPLWIPSLTALALIAGGLGLRRTGQAPIHP